MKRPPKSRSTGRPDPQAGRRAPPDRRSNGLVFVEGPGDRAILEGWARSVSPRFERQVRAATRILGGRQPARARDQLRAAREADEKTRALCILDRDAAPEEIPEATPGLEVFTWGRRHIESYLLVPGAIRRALRRQDHDGDLVRFLRGEFPDPLDEGLHQSVHAKRLLGPRGPLAAALGRPVPVGRVARAMRPDEFHSDVHALLARLQDVLGTAHGAPLVTLRRRPRG